MAKKHKKAESPSPSTIILPWTMNYSEVPLSLDVPMPYCTWEGLPPKCGRGSSSAADRQGSCEGWKTPVPRKQKRVGSRPRLWLRCTKQGFSPPCCSPRDTTNHIRNSFETLRCCTGPTLRRARRARWARAWWRGHDHARCPQMMCGLVVLWSFVCCVLFAVCRVRCGVVARLNKSTLLILGLVWGSI